MIVEWSGPARRDLIAIAGYLAANNPEAALAVIDRIDDAIANLADHPRMGRPGRVASTRELVVPGLPYIVSYRLREHRVQILRVLHAARNWPRHS